MADSSQWLVLLKTLGSLAAVLFLIYVLSIVAKKYLRPERWGNIHGEHIRVVQSFALGPKSKLMVVDVEEKRLLLGVGEESINALAELDQKAAVKQEVEKHAI